MITRGRIINVLRKPTKCPNCGEQVWPIIYGTGEMTEHPMSGNSQLPIS